MSTSCNLCTKGIHMESGKGTLATFFKEVKVGTKDEHMAMHSSSKFLVHSLHLG